MSYQWKGFTEKIFYKVISNSKHTKLKVYAFIAKDPLRPALKNSLLIEL